MLALIVVICLGIGVFTTFALHSFLVGKLDDQLTAAGRRQGVTPNGAPFTPPDSGTGSGNPQFRDRLPVGQADGTIGVFTNSAGQMVAKIRRTSGADENLSATALSQLENVAADGQPHTVTLSGYGSYRVAVNAEPNSAAKIITGLPLAQVTSTVVRLSLIITALSLIGLILAALLGALIVRLALRPLRRVTSTASKVADMQLNEGEVALAVRVAEPNPHTEVGQVGIALNRMLENVSEALNARHQSEMRVRQFVADASHELRTPLASIRGYAELTRRSREIAPPDIAHAMTRVESEAARMTTLVEDLLLLARLDAGRPLAADDVDLARLTVDVLSDAHAAGPDHRWHLDLGDADLEDHPITVKGDEARLQQVLVNILANARTHTPPGTNIWISLSRQGESASLVVRDDGPGIPPELVPDIFERFSRGEESRSRAAGSTGLGLAIVAAVVAAHAGTITVSSRPGETIFTVALPTHGLRSDGAQSSARFGGQILSV
ncbi:HAMP domain-containing histidine kinase [Jatrophihabitans telluris]|uniref:histidine kinase n=1 Tax=Jatrophihabitans telluris TaxID=2038343 RepID=A0ABY4R6B2_9ACTN|nr:HAMP domain-containing sensor histidine kinase [Jatrophihabitans telluris]UQX90336.1 HAMP domain-containing histidine kinase [Jatrophihabitans telluris]